MSYVRIVTDDRHTGFKRFATIQQLKSNFQNKQLNLFDCKEKLAMAFAEVVRNALKAIDWKKQDQKIEGAEKEKDQYSPIKH